MYRPQGHLPVHADAWVGQRRKGRSIAAGPRQHTQRGWSHCHCRSRWEHCEGPPCRPACATVGARCPTACLVASVAVRSGQSVSFDPAHLASDTRFKSLWSTRFMPRPGSTFLPTGSLRPHPHGPRHLPKADFRCIGTAAHDCFYGAEHLGALTLLGYEMNGDASPPPKRQRASRKGQPHRFECSYPGCEKRYTRAEHLARHTLNHDAKVVYRCEVEGCGHEFVRPDLFARHKRKHEDSTLHERNTSKSSSTVNDGRTEPVSRTSAFDDPTAQIERNASSTSPVLNFNASPDAPASSVLTSIEPRWRDAAYTRPIPAPQSSNIHALPPISTLAGEMRTSVPALPNQFSPPNTNLLNSIPNNDQSNDNFAAWLFDSPGSHASGFDFNNMPFLDFGMDFAPNDVWTFDDNATGLTPGLGGRTYSTASMASDQR